MKKIDDSDCVCENHLLSDHADPDITSKLTCTNGDALQAAIKAKNSRSDLVFVNIQISGSSLERISHHDFKNFQDAEHINFSDNKISVIEKDAFKNFKKLEVLDLSSNLLSHLQENAFKHLIHLKNLSISNNKLQAIENNTFYDLHNLLQLDLSQNNLSSVVIPNFLFYRVKNLNFLSLSMNQLKTLNESTFKGNTMLERINLTGNLWICDKKLLPLHDWLKKYETYKELAVCAEPPDMHYYTIQHALEILFLEMKVQESPTCNATMCNCTISKDKLVVTVDCSNRGFQRLPEMVPYKTKALNLYNNKN
ncbi:hypothetical protein CEXT_365811 [Caerostris extrusa]|uniref:Uncharacterized protein n=1 Tax=Caerostris extrusa TaxID=172846 RepID=A0AAV4VCM6_CAEEX|nr:hypothetical protein CEXT_365811 [Caerostris extrusa]